MVTVEFLVTSFVVVVVPGTGVIYTVSMGLTDKARGGMAAAIGCTLGILPHLLASALGLSAIVHGSAVLFQTVRYVGIGYLIYLAYMMWRDTADYGIAAEKHRQSWYRIAVKGILINLLNPRLTVFFLAFLPQFTARQSVVDLHALILLSAVFAGMTLIVFLAYGLLAGRISRLLLEHRGARTWAQRSLSALFAALALQLAVGDQ